MKHFRLPGRFLFCWRKHDGGLDNGSSKIVFSKLVKNAQNDFRVDPIVLSVLLDLHISVVRF